MDTLTIKYIALATLGMALHIIMKIQNRSAKGKFSLKTFFKDKLNWVRIGLAIISTVALMLMAEDLSDIFGITLKDGSPAISLFAFGAGYLNHSLVRNILKVFKKKVSNVE